MKREKKKYLAWGLTAFLTGCALLIFYDVFYRDNSGTVQAIFAKLFSVLTPVLYGLGMAYLLAPIVNFLERAILRLRDKLGQGHPDPQGVAEGGKHFPHLGCGISAGVPAAEHAGAPAGGQHHHPGEQSGELLYHHL